MLSLILVEEIDRLLKEGELSQRKIALRLGVSRGTVGAIASGRRPLYGKEPPSEEPEQRDPNLPPERCPRCGFLVYLPCLVCRTREFRRNRQLMRAITSARRGTRGRPLSSLAAGRCPKRRRARVA